MFTPPERLGAAEENNTQKAKKIGKSFEISTNTFYI